MPEHEIGNVRFGYVDGDRVVDVAEAPSLSMTQGDTATDEAFTKDVFSCHTGTVTLDVKELSIPDTLFTREMDDNPVAIMFEGSRLVRVLPRTVREAKARPKGNKGNQRRKRARTKVRRYLPNVSVDMSKGFFEACMSTPKGSGLGTITFDELEE